MDDTRRTEAVSSTQVEADLAAIQSSQTEHRAGAKAGLSARGRKRAEQGVKPNRRPERPARISLKLQETLVRPTRFELVTSCSGGKRLSRVFYDLRRKNGR